MVTAEKNKKAHSEKNLKKAKLLAESLQTRACKHRTNLDILRHWPCCLAWRGAVVCCKSKHPRGESTVGTQT